MRQSKVQNLRKTDTCEVHVFVCNDTGIKFTTGMNLNSPMVGVHFGVKDIPKMTPELCDVIVDGFPIISKIIIPDMIPALAAPFVASLLKLNRDTEIESDITIINPSPLENLPETIPCTRDGLYAPPVTVTSLDQISDGFHEIKDDINIPSTSDGFHEIKDNHDVNADDYIEHRTLKTDDIDRMNRLSYQPIASTRNETTYPEQLGGGPI